MKNLSQCDAGRTLDPHKVFVGRCGGLFCSSLAVLPVTSGRVCCEVQKAQEPGTDLESDTGKALLPFGQGSLFVFAKFA